MTKPEIEGESPQPALDVAKLVLAAVLVVSALGAFYYFEGQPLVFRVAGLLIVLAIVVALAFGTQPGRKVWAFCRDARIELRKVVWPTRQETWQATWLVVAVVFASGVFLWLLDFGLLWGIRQLIG